MKTLSSKPQSTQGLLLLAALVGAAVLTACSNLPRYSWAKEGGSQEEYSRVHYQCLQQSQQRVAVASAEGVRARSEDRMVSNPDLYNACMNASGWYFRQEPVPGVAAAPSGMVVQPHPSMNFGPSPTLPVSASPAPQVPAKAQTTHLGK